MSLSLNSLLSLTKKPSMLTTGVGIGAGLLGGAAGYGLGSMGKKREVGNVQDLFDQYNQEENKQLATEAFMAGAQFALDNEKLSEYVEAGFEDEFEKMAVSADAIGRALVGRGPESRQMMNKLYGRASGFHPEVLGDRVMAKLKTEEILNSKNPFQKAKDMIKALQKESPNIKRRKITEELNRPGRANLYKKSSLEKEAGPRLDLAKETLKGFVSMAKRDNPKVKRAIEGLELKNVRHYLNERPLTQQMAISNRLLPGKEALQDLGILGGATAGAVGIGLALKKAMKNPSTKDQVLKFISSNKRNLAIGGSVGGGAVLAHGLMSKESSLASRIGEAVRMKNIKGLSAIKKFHGKTPGLSSTDAKILKNQKSLAAGDAMIDASLLAGGVGIGLALKKALKKPSVKNKILKALNKNKKELAIGGGVLGGGVLASQLV